MTFNTHSVLNAHNYETICKYTYLPAYGKFITPDFLNGSGNIFCKTDFVVELFSQLAEAEGPFNLITHHSDYPITAELFKLKPRCVKKWFALNPVFKHPDLIPLPLGLKTHAGYYLEPQYMTEWFSYNINRLRQVPKTENIYCNWNITNQERNKIVTRLDNAQILYTYETNLPFNEYIERMSKHKYVISPPGNGIDCHRTWEALYVGCIPIVIKNEIYDSWSDLPILQVEDYANIKQDLLDEFETKSFNLSKLSIEYWKSVIK